MKVVKVRADRLAAVNLLLNVIVLMMYILLPAFKVRAYEHLNGITETYITHLSFINLVMAISLIAFLIVFVLNVFSNILLYAGFYKKSMPNIASFVMAASLLFVFVASVLYCIDASSKSFYLAAYLNIFIVLIYIGQGIMIRLK